MMWNKFRAQLFVVAALPVVAWCNTAAAQGLGNSAGISSDEIIVTARKRDETSISVPVVLTAVGGEELNRRGIVNLDSVGKIVPGLILGNGSSTTQGGVLGLRGITGADNNLLGDQAVAFNVDGIAIARASVRRLSQLDMAQIEVLKGPQALFYGKNSPGGIITIRSNDPTDWLEAQVRAGYEFYANEWRGDGYISGPLTENIGARLAFYGSTSGGYFKNRTPRESVIAPKKIRDGATDEYAGRLTLKYDGDKFDARLKLAYSHLEGASTAATQLLYCPSGSPFLGHVDTCKPDRNTSNGDLGALSTLPGWKKHPFVKQNQFLGGLEMNFELADDVALTSTTGAYMVKIRNVGNFDQTYIPSLILASIQDVNIKEYSQELRLQSSFDGPLNFVMGVYGQKAVGRASTLAALNAVTPTVLGGNSAVFKQKTTALSAFGQMIWDITPKLELTAGGRYSYEKKTLPVHRATLALVQVPVLTEEAKFDDFSPEIILTYRPSADLTVFGGYKRSFLSGGFNTGAPPPTPGVTTGVTGFLYDPTVVKGFEGGIKARLLNGALRTNFSVYSYKVSGLQLAVTINSTQIAIFNAADAKTKGAEFDFTYRTPLDGLTLNGAVGYNDAKYSNFISNCWRGQEAPDCRPLVVPATGAITLAQDLSGAQVIRAPKWTGNVGFDYQTPIGGSLKIGLLGSMNFSSGYFTDATNAPAGRMPSYQMFDATLRLADVDDRWELALIGRNLTNKFVFLRTSDGPFTGVGSTTGCATPGCGRPADKAGAVEYGRTVMVRVAYKFGGI